MAIDQSRLDDFAGIDEVVSNQRVRAYREGTTYGSVSDTNANPYGVMYMQGTGVPVSLAGTTQTLTAAQLGSGLIVGGPTSASTYTLDSATNILTYMQNNSAGVQVGDFLQCLLVNGSAFTITLAVPASGAFDAHQTTTTVVTGASKLINIRITNITTPAYIVYF